MKGKILVSQSYLTFLNAENKEMLCIGFNYLPLLKKAIRTSERLRKKDSTNFVEIIVEES